MQRDGTRDAETEAGIAQVACAGEVHEHGHVGAGAVERTHAAQGAAHGEAQRFQNGREQLRVLEAVPAAAASDELVLHGRQFHPGMLSEQHLHVAERERENMGAVQPFEQAQVPRGGGELRGVDVQCREVAGDVHVLDPPRGRGAFVHHDLRGHGSGPVRGARQG